MTSKTPILYNNVPIEDLSYRDFCLFLQSIGSAEKAAFEKRIVGTSQSVFGVYSPQKDEIYRYLKKRDHAKILTFPDENFEVCCLKGRLIAGSDLPFCEKKELLLSWLQFVDSWAHTDSVMKGVRLKKTEQQEWYSFSCDLVSRNDEFFVRFGVILFLTYFLKEDTIDGVFAALSAVKTGAYYVDMAIAWLCATALIHHKQKTLRFLQTAENLNVFTIKKSYQKARESFRISDSDKEEYASYLAALSKK